MFHSLPPQIDRDHRSLIWMERNELLLAILHAEAEGFTATADALMELLRLLETQNTDSRRRA